MRLNRAETTRQRRLKIIESAALCFIQKGFHQSSMRDIATTAEVSLGNLYNHFPSKEALIAEIATLEADVLAKIDTSLERAGDAIEVIKGFARKYRSYCRQAENVALSAEITAEAVRNPAIAKGFARNRTELVRKIAKRIDGGIEQGEIAGVIDSIHAAEMILDLVEGCAIRSTLVGDTNSRTTSKHLMVMIDRYLASSP